MQGKKKRDKKGGGGVQEQRRAEEEAIRKAEEEAKANMDAILRFDSVKDEEKEYLRRKE